jgi:hypothetical protein
MTLKARIALTTTKGRKDLLKEFKDLDEFNNYKGNQLNTNTLHIKYSLLFENQKIYTPTKTEYGINRDINCKKRKTTDKFENLAQQRSRQNQLALLGNKLINLNITPSIIRKFNKFMDNKPVTDEEKKIIKSLMIFDKLSVSQYNLLKDIEERVNKRKPLLSN